MAADLCMLMNELRERNCFSEKDIEEPISVINIGSDATDAKGDPFLEIACFTTEDLEEVLAQRSALHYKVRIYSICQKRSFTSLSTTDIMFQRILETHDVTTDFCELVERFRHTTDHRTGEACCGPQLSNTSADKTEIAYLFKYPESNGRADGADPWSLRQTAVYHQYNHRSQQTTWILINPYPRSPAWRNLLAYLKQEMPLVATNLTQFGVHNIILASYLGNWKPYLLYYEQTVSSMSNTLLGTKIRHSIEYNYDSLGRLRYIQGRCLPLKSIFSSYGRGLTELSNISARLLSSNCLQHEGEVSPSSWILSHKQRLAAYQDHSDALKVLCEFTVELLSDRLAFKQSSSVLELTKLSVDDSATVRVITVITLAYLSFTVIATIMELPFFQLGSVLEILEVSSQFWIYIAVSVPLTFLTILYWRVAVWLKIRERRKRFPLEEKDLA